MPHFGSMLERTLRPPAPIDLRATLAPHLHGSGDPTMRFAPTGIWRATHTPDGPATIRLRREGSTAVRVSAWGSGAEWAIERSADLIGESDDPSPFEPRDRLLRELTRRLPGLRISRTNAVVEALVPAILEQKVTGEEAHRSFRRLVRTYGETPPGPPAEIAALRLAMPPRSEVLALIPYHALHPLGLERRRADVIRTAASHARRLEELTDHPLDAAYRRLRAIPGVGAWTAAEVAFRALGDPDAVSVGDFHIPNLVAWALAGEPRGTDERMLELLEPYRGQRGRVIRLLEASGISAPRFGPRLAGRRIEAI